MDLLSRVLEYETDGWVSDHFRRAEFECPCCGRYVHCRRLLIALEALRSALGDSPIHVLSGNRCPLRNSEVGGAAQSRHLHGDAADIVVRGKLPDEVAAAAEKIEAFSHGGIGLYPTKGFTHLDVRPAGPARWRG